MLTSLQAVRARCALLRRLDDRQLAELAVRARPVEIAPGELLLREDEADDSVYVLVAGSVEVLAAGGSVERQRLGLVEPGGLLGEVALYFGGRRTSSARALTPCRLARLAAEDFRALLDAHPGVADDVAARVLARLRRSQLATHLTRLFGSLSADLLTELEDRVEWITLGGGEELFRQGDEADRAYVVLSGRLQVSVARADGSERTANEVGRGETLGEAALLAEGTRSATVRALRDTELAAFSRDRFAALVQRHPQAMMPVTHVVLQRLQSSAHSGSTPRPRVTTIAVVAAETGRGLAPFVERFASALGRIGATAVVDSERVDRQLAEAGIAQCVEGDVGNLRLVPWLLELEDRHRYLIYQADATCSPWSERCLRQADHVLLIADAGGDARPGEIEDAVARRRTRGGGCGLSLVLLREDGRPAGTDRWLAPREVDQHLHVRAGREQDFDRLARIVTGNALGLVLGGGGARGFAHIGVLRALRELGVTVDMLGGTSMGAVIAGLYALGHDADEVHEICRRAFVRLLDYTFPAVSLLRGQRIGDRCNEILGEHMIEDLAIPYFAVSTNLTRAEAVIHRSGGLRNAVRASISIPGVLPPVHHGSDLLIDGGILNNVPDDVMRQASGGGPVIAVDVSQKVELSASPGVGSEQSGWEVLLRRCNPFASPPAVPGIISVLQRAIDVRGVAARRRPRPETDLYLQLPLAEWGLLQFDALEDVSRRGYEMTREAIAAWSEARSGNQPMVRR